MRIEWLNDELTHARLTRGWWKKETTEVRWIRDIFLTHYNTPPANWEFVGGVRCPYELERTLDKARTKERTRRRLQRQEDQWKPARSAPLPTARVVSKG